MFIFKLVALSFIFLTLPACENFSISFTPAKKTIPSHNSAATQAEHMFWNTLHKGDYKNITQAEHLLTAAYLQNPNDPQLAAHLGFLHIWKITERQRNSENNPLIVNEIILAKKYFSDAVELNPQDARYLGFLGDSQLVEGQIFHDERQQVKGYYTLKKAIHQWPEFNYFTAGYVMSTLPPDSVYFKEGLAWQWATLDLCAGKRIDKHNPDFSPYMSLETNRGPKRACWNSWIAPYNFEGFFLNMGDMLVKSGDWQTAIKIYHNATLASNYPTWPYRSTLEKRIVNAKNNVKNFQTKSLNADKQIMFNSGYGCVACHQNQR